MKPPTGSGEHPPVGAAAFNDRTRGIVVNTPNNPTGKVCALEELEAIA